MEDTMRTRITTFIRARRAAIVASASFCERCGVVCTADCRRDAQRDRVRFDPNRVELFR
jgi:hypothetical protein